MFLNDGQVRSPETNEIEIGKVLQHYFEGYLNAESDELLKAFHRDAKLFSVGSEGEIDSTDMNAWLLNLRTRKETGDVRKAKVEVLGVDVTCNTAVAKVKLNFSEFFFVDYLSLVKLNTNWIIINKIYSRGQNAGGSIVSY